MKLVTVADMRKIEAAADKSGYTYDMMMEQAGEGLAQVVNELAEDLEDRSVLGLVGPGNNGGDTLVALADLVKDGWVSRAYLVRPRPKTDPLISRALDVGVEILEMENDQDYVGLDVWLATSEVWLDGVLGTGARLPLKPEIEEVLAHVGAYSRPGIIVAVDCPSGVDCETGEAADSCLMADLTVCMEAVKTGLLKFPAFELIGDLVTVELGLPDGLSTKGEDRREVITEDRVGDILPERPMDAHKGTFGTAFVVAGSINFTGAAYFAGKAAYRIGAGLVRMAIPGALHGILAGQIPEATWLILPQEQGVIAANASEVLLENLERATAMLLGPGFGLEEKTGEFVRHLLTGKGRKARRAAMGFTAASEVKVETPEPVKLPPLVIDADGLKLLAKIEDWPDKLPEGTILTPHPGEMAVLSGLTTEEIQKDRLAVAEKFAKKWNCVLVLKGALTIIAAPDGRVAVVPVATPALAGAGTGDVLSGILVGLRAQGVPAYETAVAGAWIHAQAGLMAEEALGHPASVLAGDVLDAIADVLGELEG